MYVPSKIVLVSSGVVLFGVGVGLDFLPQETARLMGAPGTPAVAALVQVLAAALLGVGILNWLSRENRVGGIYGRPLALGNFLLFGVAAMPLWRTHSAGGLAVIASAAVATVFALAYAWLLFFADPVGKETPRSKE
ncbi:MAG TPA: hypothetical protein VF392_08660 [Terracidiphilus sp.]